MQTQATVATPTTPTTPTKTKKNVGWGNWLAGGRKKQFINAIKKGNLAEVKRLIGEGVQLSPKNKYDEYDPLFYACLEGNNDIIRTLLDAGAKVEIEGAYSSYLMIVVSRGNVEGVKLFLERGANVNFYGKESHTPMSRACKYYNKEIIDILTKAGAKENCDSPLIQQILSRYSRKSRKSRKNKKANTRRRKTRRV
jgi:ankyrin repeat protein